MKLIEVLNQDGDLEPVSFIACGLHSIDTATSERFGPDQPFFAPVNAKASSDIARKSPDTMFYVVQGRLTTGLASMVIFGTIAVR